jgi:hypothetical protein
MRLFGMGKLIWSLGRALITDPELPAKAKEGRIEEIRKCIVCNCCVGRESQSLSLKCSVNADVGRESQYRIKKPAIPERPSSWEEGQREWRQPEWPLERPLCFSMKGKTGWEGNSFSLQNLL